MKSLLYTRTGDQGTTSLVGGERVKKNSLRLEAYGTIDELSSFIGQVISDTPRCLSITEEKLAKMERWIDLLDEATPKIRAFVLPGGCPLAATTHVARAVCRRAERRLLDLADAEYVDPAVIIYVNRLSDYLFIAARHFNHLAGVEEIIWKK